MEAIRRLRGRLGRRCGGRGGGRERAKDVGRKGVVEVEVSEVGGGGEEGEEFGGRLGSPPFGAWGRVKVVDHDVDEDSEGLEGGNEGEEEADDLLDPDFGDEVQRGRGGRGRRVGGGVWRRRTLPPR